MRVIFACLATLAVPASAFGGTVTVTHPFANAGPRLNFTDTTGKDNALTITHRGKTVTVEDRRAKVSAGPGCTRTNAHVAVCAGPARSKDLFDGVFTRLALGKGDDTTTFRGGFVASVIIGGAGDDVLTGSGADDVLRGGGGHDKLYGLSGNDTLSDGDGAAGRINEDTLDGGPGFDRLNYRDRATGVDIDVAAGTGSEDAVASVEYLISGSGDDTLTGTDASNDFSGGGGHDTMTGLGGGDSFKLGGGGTVDAGPGRDTILVHGPDPASTTVTCGPGEDTVKGRPADHVTNDCEYVFAGNLQVGPAYTVRRGKQLDFDVYCRRTCNGALTIRRTDGTVVATSEPYELVGDGEGGDDDVYFTLTAGLQAFLVPSTDYVMTGEDGTGFGFTATVSS